jgi:hypothetical protein
VKLWLLAMLTCASCARQIPPHLLVELPSGDEASQRNVVDLQSAVALIASRDPLVRAPPLPTRASLSQFPEGEPLLAYLDTIASLERGEGAPGRELQQLEEVHPLTIVVPLARGYRLRMVENRLAGWNQPNEALESEIARLLVPLPAAVSADSLPRRPLEWVLGGDTDPARIRELGDAWALRGWLASPELPLTAVALSISEPRYTMLAQSPLGTLLVRRASGSTAASETGWSALEEATWLSLNRSAADRDHEQAKWASLRQKAGSTIKSDDPILALLEQARASLTEDASSDRSAGAVLLSVAAISWSEGCSPTCSRVDRVTAMEEASRWHPQVQHLARVWQVIALKDAIDTLEVGHDTILYPRAVVGLVDALSGTGGRGLDQSLLRQQKPDPSTWLMIGRAIGAEGITDWDGARTTLGRHLASVVEHTVAGDPPERYLPLLERIGERAVP